MSKSINTYKTISEKMIKTYNDNEYYKNYFISSVLSKHIVTKDGSPDTKKINQLQILTLPFIKFITDGISQLYSKPVLRSINTEDEKILDLFNEITNSFDEVSEEIDKYTFAGGMTAVKAHYDDIDDEFKFVLYTANMVDYTPRSDDYTKAEELYLTFFYDESQQEEVWDSKKYYYSTGNSTPKETENPYGEIPFEVFKNRNVPNSWYCPPNSNLLDVQDYVSNQNTQLGNTFKFQSMSMLVVKGGANLKEMHIGANAVNKVDTEDSIDYINPSTDLNGLVEVINEQIKMSSRINGIPDSLISASATSSGVSLTISQKALDDYLKNRATKFRKTEEKLLLKGMRVLAYHRGIKLPTDLKISLNYTSANQMTKLTQDEIALWNFYIEKGTFTELDLMMSMFPNLTKDEAEKKLLENKNLLKQNKIENNNSDIKN